MVVLGIDIGGAQIKAGMVDEKGAILASRTISTPPDLDSFVPSLHEAVRWLLEATSLPSGVGVGCKGIVNPDSTQIETLPGTLHYLEGLRLSELVGLPMDVPVFADNDARVAMAGELVWGAAPGARPDDHPGHGRRRRCGDEWTTIARFHRRRRPSRPPHRAAGWLHLRLRQPRVLGNHVFGAGD